MNNEFENTPITPSEVHKEVSEEPTPESVASVLEDAAASTEEAHDALTPEAVPAQAEQAPDTTAKPCVPTREVFANAAETPGNIEKAPTPEAKTSAPNRAPRTYQILVDPNTGKYVYAEHSDKAGGTPYTQPVSAQYAEPTPELFANPYEAVPQTQKAKSGGSKAFMVVLIVLLAIFSTGFFLLCGYLLRDAFIPSYDPFAPTAPTEESTLPEEELPNNVIPNDENDKSLYSGDTIITFSPLPSDKDNSSKYTTQYAYNIISDSTVGVVCYNGKNFNSAESQGTGIIISEDGYIVTNSHVIGDSKSLYNVRVTTADGTTYEASVIGYDSRTDLAVLKINGKNLKSATFANSDDAYIGQDVIAVGNPGGMDFQNSLTKGILSAKDRKLNLSSQVSFLQTDAAINPGNSGGALCNLYGQVIGITSAKISDSAYEGMGFAIPSYTVKEVVDDLASRGFVEGRVRIGITGQAITTAMQQYYDVPSGILVGTIDEDGPCAGTELEVDDIITKFDGKQVTSFSDMYNYLAEHKAGDKVTLTVYRLDTDKTFEIEITLMADNGETQN